ncbi:MAG: HEAT repeat domain-containing protein [Candidatus Bathyarchaeota archaeon]|nr:HEAT repeat domain-containing protein [Candidatus Bathyarchaeota archaeon]
MRERIEERNKAKEELAAVPDKESVAKHLVDRLPDEEDPWRRAWIVSALGEIKDPSTIEEVAARLDPDKEEAEWVRFWAAVSLAKMKPTNLENRLVKAADDDEDHYVKAVALRLLVENGFKSYDERLLKMARSKDWGNKAAACKALRHNVGPHPFPEYTEERFVDVLKDLLGKEEAMDVRREAALALGNVKYKCSEAIEALTEALRKNRMDRDRSIRLYCVRALYLIGRPESKDALMEALQDIDAEVRLRAAYSLKKALGADGAVELIIGELLRHDKPENEFQNSLDALKLIAREKAADVLTDNLQHHHDPKVRERAMFALTQLGGEEAVRALQTQRASAMTRYATLLDRADKQIGGQFDNMMVRAQEAFSTSMWMHKIVFAIGVIMLAAGLYLTLSEGLETFESYIGIGMAGGSLGTLLLVFYKNPLANVDRSVNKLAKIDVIFSGYVRQIRQIDATFEQMFLSSPRFGVEQMKETVTEIKNAVEKTMGEIGKLAPVPTKS